MCCNENGCWIQEERRTFGEAAAGGVLRLWWWWFSLCGSPAFAAAALNAARLGDCRIHATPHYTDVALLVRARYRAMHAE